MASDFIVIDNVMIKKSQIAASRPGLAGKTMVILSGSGKEIEIDIEAKQFIKEMKFDESRDKTW